MNAEQQARDAHAKQAAVERLWSHTVGIANRAEPLIGTDPISGMRAREEEAPGTGVAGSWGKHNFVLTAKHVLEKAGLADLTFFARPTGAFTEKSAVEIGDALVALPLKDSAAKIHRCEWDDLALVTLSKDSLGSYLEFVDIATASAEPQEGETVVGLGFPVSTGFMFERKVGPNFQRAILLNPTGFSGEVLQSAAGKYFKGFNSDLHYLIPFELAKQGKHPRGISGPAVWLQSVEKQFVWTPKFSFAGVCTSAFKDGTIEQIIKPSVVRQFLTEALGPAI